MGERKKRNEKRQKQFNTPRRFEEIYCFYLQWSVSPENQNFQNTRSGNHKFRITRAYCILIFFPMTQK